jgi:carbamoyl-phosphate synthase small subunit
VKAVLVLENGAYFYGEALHNNPYAVGEVVFNTSMTGYQEVLTDPAYRGQILILTYPLIGNVGVNEEDAQSSAIHPRGLVVKELAKNPSNFRTEKSLIEWIIQHDLVCIEGVDTRALAGIIRDYGTLRGIIASAEYSIQELLEKVQQMPFIKEEDLVGQVTTQKPYSFASVDGPTLAVIDCGVKKSTLNYWAKEGYRIRVLPAQSSLEEIMAENPAGVIFSDGPGDPRSVSYGVNLAKELMGKVPVWGIGLGSLLIALALDCKVEKLKYGHRGANQPVKDLNEGKVYITAQNHSFVVSKDGLSDHIIITHENLDDESIEGFRHVKLPVFGQQYTISAASVENQSRNLIDQFNKAVR